MCLATAALIAGSVTSSGGLAAVAIRKLGVKLSREENGAGESAPRSNQSTE
ncbi:hypothetical protein HDF10_002610 [Edaphobacter lichenicola]|uniref:Uncharacterized protein n=1 Tax=Tunturiibacter lichenicola TaxID=2051959 RepID=A0A7W8JB30_9BACT|nr:hypothetical protein [Edaphobacter lichenicola]